MKDKIMKAVYRAMPAVAAGVTFAVALTYYRA